MATGVERLKADPDTLSSEMDKLKTNNSEPGESESNSHGITSSNAIPGAHSEHVGLTESAGNVGLTSMSMTESSEVDETNKVVKDHRQTEREDDDFFEARVSSNPEPSENDIQGTDLASGVENNNISQSSENINEFTCDAKVYDMKENESHSEISEVSAENNGFHESSESASVETVGHRTSDENDVHANSNRTDNEQTRDSANQGETEDEVHVGHIRGSAESGDGSESSDTEGEYESADEGEEIQVDADQLKDLEESLTEEQKEERRNLAQVLKDEGNELFRCGSYKSAIKLYSRALRTCPLKFAKDRAIMYSNRAVCKMKLTDNEAAIRDCSKALDLHPHYLKALMRRAELYEKTEKLDEALADYQKIVEQDPSQHSARAACMRLPEQIKDRNEKMKAEMMDKLKDLGNLILRPFGLSTNNFQLNQNPDTGGYSVNFVQNPGQ